MQMVRVKNDVNARVQDCVRGATGLSWVDGECAAVSYVARLGELP